ncbi:MAG TPA: site-specific integrase [Polyangiales bacterium]|nr:site-specific integrase [Polyangiales bacterium]
MGKELGLLRSALRYMAKQRGPDGFKLYRYDTDEIFPEGVIGNYKPRDRALSINDYHALYVALAPERREYLQAFCGLGARDSELYRITPVDVEAEKGRVRIPGTKTEAAERWLPPPAELFDILLARSVSTPLGRPLFPRWLNVRRDLEAACKRAGIAKVSPNDLRRTFATWQAEAGVPEAVTASLMGHTSSAMVRRVYARIGSDAKRDALAKLPPLAPPPGVMLSLIDESAKPGRRRQERRPASTALSTKPRFPAVSLCPETESNRRHEDFDHFAGTWK